MYQEELLYCTDLVKAVNEGAQNFFCFASSPALAKSHYGKWD